MRSGTAPVSARAVVVSEAAPKKFEIAIEVESPALTALEHGFDDYLQRLGEPGLPGVIGQVVVAQNLDETSAKKAAAILNAELGLEGHEEPAELTLGALAAYARHRDGFPTDYKARPAEAPTRSLYAIR